MEAKDKLGITRTCFDLGLRITSSVFSLVHENEEDPVRYIVEIVRERYRAVGEREMANEELQRRARKTLASTTRMICYSIVKRISYAVGSPDLESTYDKLVEEEPTPARELVRASIMLDHTKREQFPFADIKRVAYALGGIT